jgi:type I restriction enzyme S subunit
LMLYNVDRIRGVGLSGGAATPILNKTSFSGLKIRIPSKPEQRHAE